jgi:hypothetical protein
MSKVIAIKSARTKEPPANAGRASCEKQFDKIFDGMHEPLNALMCAYAALKSTEGFAGVDKEAAAAVVGNAYRNLKRLHNDLDGWYVGTIHTPKEAQS